MVAWWPMDLTEYRHDHGDACLSFGIPVIGGIPQDILRSESLAIGIMQQVGNEITDGVFIP